eukprot:CAMPEP_0195652892 /NCGR_PEP_ID=MMETSP0815-20121206/33074_1 /TAXON_ID=97485 /ORGANISM="Prymnesium parvum, Strain Texoma1" /LENGTH=35 /DNA_ID= /DNA_START= /DNA_END= /DNA_ORIENTATION=
MAAELFEGMIPGRLILDLEFHGGTSIAGQVRDGLL